MPRVISNTSPLLYLYRIGAIEWLPLLFDAIWTPEAVVQERRTGRRKGYAVPEPQEFGWLQIVNPTAMPSEWLSLDLGAGELAAMALALENPTHVVLFG